MLDVNKVHRTLACVSLGQICTKWATPEAPEKAKKVKTSYTDSIINWMDQSKFKQEEAIINQTVTPQNMTPLSAAIDFLAHIKGIEYHKCRLERSKYIC